MIKDWDYEPDDYLLLMQDSLRGNINAQTYTRKLFSTNSKRSISSEASSIIIQKAYSEADAYNPNIRLDYTITERQLRRFARLSWLGHRPLIRPPPRPRR